MNRHMRLLAVLLAVLLLTGCTHTGILVRPTVPTGSSEEIPESTALETEFTVGTEATVETESTTAAETSRPAETTMPEETAPQASSAPVETAPPTEATVPVQTVSPTEATQPEQTTAPKPSRPDPYDVERYTVSPEEQALLDGICAMRTQKQLPQLSVDGKLSALAYLRSFELSRSFGHTRPDGKDYSTVFGDYGYGFSASAEVMLKSDAGYPAEYILDDWLHSALTNELLLSSEFTHVGVGIYEQDGRMYVICLLTAK